MSKREATIKAGFVAATIVLVLGCLPSSPPSAPPGTAPATHGPSLPPSSAPTAAASPITTSLPSAAAGTPTLVGTADLTHSFTNGEYHMNSTAHAKDVVWQLDSNSTVRPPGISGNDQVRVFTPVSGELNWSYEALVQGNFDSTCTIKDSGTVSLTPGPDNNAYLFIVGSGPATYSIDANYEAFPTKTCLESEAQAMDGKWLESDPAKFPQVQGTDNALVLDDSYTAGGTQFGATISDDYSWSFASAP